MAFLPVAAESIFRNYEESHFPFTSPQDFQAGAGVPDLLMRRSSGMDPAEEFHADDDGSDDGSQMLGEKKRRLNLEQVKALEKSFELGNKLEPERKMQLARALGLQPRQIAIWFQNRRARWKTKQLEKDYDILKRQIDALKADNDALKSQNKKLHTQLLGLRSREPTGSGEINLNKENEGNCWSNGNETACEVNLKTSSTTDSRLYLNHHHRHKRNKQHGFPTAQEVFHSSSRPDLPVSNFPNMFGSIQDSQEFWPWSDHHQNFQ